MGAGSDGQVSDPGRAFVRPAWLPRWLAWTPPSGGAHYRPQLDGLRSVAVMLVLYSHFWDPASLASAFGVKLFFVLSGYLITGILLDARGVPGAKLRHFYLRRGLRLWPAYYLVLGLAVLANADGIRAVAWWHALYASNVLFALREAYVPWLTAAWWSLAVEEQFYLLWPLIILTVPNRLHAVSCLVLVGLGLAIRLLLDFSGAADQVYSLLPAVLDGLAGGALLTVLRRAGARSLVLLPAAGLAGLAVWAGLLFAGMGETTWATLPLLAALMALVDRGANGPPDTLARALSLSPAVFLGRISYGIYLYHLPLWWLVMHSTDWWRVSSRGPVLFAGMALLTILVATLSWFLLEAPANRLKRRFPYP
jgi:peptidoglycan/LPS O-acetylase OafA/YrhL